MRGAVAVASYLAVLGVGSVVQDPKLLAAGLLGWVLVAGPDAPRLLRRTALAVGAFALGVSAGVVVGGLWGSGVDGTWLLRTNLRMVLLTATTLLAAERIDWAHTFRRWPTLVGMGQLVRVQIRVLCRLHDDFRLGLASRSPHRPRTRTMLRHGAASGAFLVGRAIQQADEIGLALRARGVGSARR